ncbi:MAG TPA: ShlB/FhaC/HecB family hemolysin secretion/activation protein [Gallionella sp.]|nr:ShlB/FhaC/HecB family hemolysin secretion/activation protein [Gallionella sp.]
MVKQLVVVSGLFLQLLMACPAFAESIKFEVTGFSVEGNTLLPAEQVQSALAPFVGADREMADVNKAAEALHALYQNAGYAVVQVIPPQQIITSGNVLLKVVEDKIVSIEVTGNKAYSAENIRASLPALKPGASLNAKRLESGIVLANENSAKQVAVNVQPGAKLGDINARIDVTEDRIEKYIGTIDNTGSAATGFTKIGFAYQNANLFDRDHALTLQYSGSLDMIDKVYSLSAGYHVPLYSHNSSVDLIAAYSSSSTTTPSGAGSIYFSGQGSILGARLNYALPSVGEIQHKVILGADYKDTTNQFSGCVAPCGSITEIPLSLTYFAQANNPGFQGSGNVSWLQNISGGPHGGLADYQASRFVYPGISAKPTWSLLRFNATGAVPVAQDWQARAQLNGQYTNEMLIGAEQLGAGGASSVRGYPERVAAGDYGYVVNLELYTPDMNKLVNLSNGSLRALVFWDAASLTVNDQWGPAISRNTNFDSVGVGARLMYKKDLSIKLDVGWAQKALPGAAPSPVKQNDVAGHVAVAYIF